MRAGSMNPDSNNLASPPAPARQREYVGSDPAVTPLEP
jgi:hypothetical protein